MFISEIINEGFDVIVTVLSDGLKEIQALKLEEEMIIAFGTERNGGYSKKQRITFRFCKQEIFSAKCSLWSIRKSTVGVKFSQNGYT